MEPRQPGEDVSGILRAWSDGDPQALDRLTPIVYDELHRLARRYMRRERPGHGLQTTALVNEAYLRLVGYTRMRWQDRAHFFAVSAQVMRRVLVDYARRQNLRRGAGVPHLSLDHDAPLGPEPLEAISRSRGRCDRCSLPTNEPAVFSNARRSISPPREWPGKTTRRPGSRSTPTG